MRKLLQEIQIPIPGGYVAVYLCATGPGAWTTHTIYRLPGSHYMGGSIPFETLRIAHRVAWEHARVIAGTFPGAGLPRTVYLHTPREAQIARGALLGFVSDAAPATGGR